MCALTRQRTAFDGVFSINELVTEYYCSRADFGFTLTECSGVSEISNAFPGCTMIYNEQQT